jgi:hypothetical protein
VEIPVSVASVPGIRSVPSSAKALVSSYWLRKVRCRFPRSFLRFLRIDDYD